MGADLPKSAPVDPAATCLAELGWRPFFSSQVSAEDEAALLPFRVMAVHRGKIAVAGALSERLIAPGFTAAPDQDSHATVGDWLLIDDETSQISRILRRENLFTRRTPGSSRKVQLIAANVDTVFIVASCNQDFNPARVERYLVLARDSGVIPVIVLTKADLADRPEDFAAALRELQADLKIETVDARDRDSVARLGAWCAQGQTVTLLGSSGVGKSTLINTLTGSAGILTQPVRENDGKGRHTTTVRQMHRLDQGGWLMDTPGMRELHLSDVSEGLAEVFDDILSLELDCRFSNCLHGNEPDCAVRSALAQGDLDRARYDRWRKLSSDNAPESERGRRKRPA